MAAIKRLLVEGNDDEHVLYHLLEHHEVPEEFEIKNKGGVDNIVETLHVEVLASELECLGIMVDADINPAARWRAIRNRLLTVDYPVPEDPNPEGTIVDQPGKPTVGIWLMPNNTAAGMLEDFAGFLVPDEDPLWQRAETCINSIPEEQRRFSMDAFAKAHIHTWLAWQEDPGTPLGLAITKKYLDAGAPQANMLIQWIRSLFRI